MIETISSDLNFIKLRGAVRERYRSIAGYLVTVKSFTVTLIAALLAAYTVSCQWYGTPMRNLLLLGLLLWGNAGAVTYTETQRLQIWKELGMPP